MIEIKLDKWKILDKLNPMQVLVLGFASIIAIGTALLSLPNASSSGHSMGFINALFEATSAVCVTGLTVVNTAKDLSLFGQIVIICLIQIGGLGFMTMATLIFLLMGKRITLKERLIMQQALNQFSTQGVVKLTKYIIVFTLLTELVGAICLTTVFIPDFGFAKGIFYSIFHSISAFCNAGFDLLGDSFSQYTTHISLNIIIMLLITIGGIGFTVIIDIRNNLRFKSWSLHTKLVMVSSLILTLFGAIIFFLLEYQYTLTDYSFGNKILASFFQSVTTRTAGFNTLPLDQLTDASKFIFVVLMFIGASPASTGGGIKTVTAVVLVLMIITATKGKKEVNIFGKRISQDTTMRALSVVAINIGLLVIFTIFLTAFESLHFIDLFFETASALGTVGLATFDTALLSIPSKFIIIISMFIGRVGPLTLVLALARKQSLKKPPVRYPEGKVMVG